MRKLLPYVQIAITKKAYHNQVKKCNTPEAHNLWELLEGNSKCRLSLFQYSEMYEFTNIFIEIARILPI